MIYGVPICAYGNVTPRRSKHKLYLKCSGTFASSLVSRHSSALILIKRDLTNSPDPAQAVQGRPKPSASNNYLLIFCVFSRDGSSNILQKYKFGNFLEYFKD
jgi:hypothetical protein